MNIAILLAGGVGQRLGAGIGAGLYADCFDAVEKCVKIAKVYKPDSKKVWDYEEAFSVWERCYRISNLEIYK